MKPARRRQVVDHLRGAWRVSPRRACAVLKAPRSTYRHRSRRDAQAQLRSRIREIAEARVRYGYRRIRVLLRREGWAVNHKRVWRLYRLEGLQLRSKMPGTTMRLHPLPAGVSGRTRGRPASRQGVMRRTA